jgi:hypothetical protein
LLTLLASACGMFWQASQGRFQQRLLDLLRVVADFVVTVAFIVAQFQAIQRAGGGQRVAFVLQTIFPPGIGFAGDHRQQRG